LVFLFFLWSRYFLGKFDQAFIVFALVAYNAAIYVDIRVGNVSLFEQIVIWLGFYFFIQRKFALFAVLILAASILKITPLLLLGLLLLENRRGYIYLGLAVGSFLSIQFVSYLLSPALFSNFLVASSGLSDHGVVNPSTFEFVRALLSVLRIPNTGASYVSLAGPIYLAIAGGIMLVAVKALRFLSGFAAVERRLWSIYFACLTYGLILPRFKTYSFIIVLVPTYSILTELARRLAGPNSNSQLIDWLCLLGIGTLSSIYIPIFGERASESSLLGYAAWAALAITWGIFVSGIGLRKRGWLFGNAREMSMNAGNGGTKAMPMEAASAAPKVDRYDVFGREGFAPRSQEGDFIRQDGMARME
jgi:hypothetical protein